jgi:hypothetical protein
MSKGNKNRQQPIPVRAQAVAAPKPAMMEVPMGYDPSGKMESVDIVSTKEAWTEFTLDDGSVIRTKAPVLDVKRAVGQFSADGNPLYILQTALVSQVKSTPARLRKKG